MSGAPGATPVVDPLALLADLSSAFASSGDLGAALVTAIERIAGHVGAEAGALFLLEDEGRTLVCRACTGPVQIRGLRLAAGQGIVGRCCRDDALQHVRDVREDPSWEPAVDVETGFTTRSILCVPLRVGKQRLGAIELVNKQSEDGRFSEADARLLEGLAASAALALQNARNAEELVRRERISRDLELASEIQRSMLPSPRPAPFPVVGSNRPARGVSGDFYDWLDLRDGPEPRIPFCVGDVSGKGINAALLAAKTASLFRCLARDLASPAEILARLNAELVETATRGMFVTMAAGCLLPGEGGAFDRVRLALAGHPPALIGPAGKRLEAIESGGPPLGITAPGPSEPRLFETTHALDGGALYLFTDGVSERRSAADVGAGLEAVRELIAAHAALPLRERIAALSAADEAVVVDDATWLIVESAPGGGATPPAAETGR